MRSRLLKLLLLAAAALGGVIWWQRRNETPPLPPPRASEPFMDPVVTKVAAGAGVPVAGEDQPDTELVVQAESAAPPSPAPLPDPPHGPFTQAPDGPPDDLKRISGVGPKLEQLLNEQGITTFAQIAGLSDADVDRLQQRMPQFPGRIRRDDWVGQAARLQAE
jgi:predicted flap endonuclease-1-like 5' DNA nuclease